jgi:Adenylate cyclase, family 3 (some proteins contain HAMP domain)
VKVRANIAQMLKKGLYESLDADMLERMAQDVIPDYDLHERTGFPPNIPMQGQTAASRIVDDMMEEDLFLHFVERLTKLDREGFMGRSYRIGGLREIYKYIGSEGYLWDSDTGLFMEDSRIRRTQNWGRLLPGEEYRFSVLRIDIVKNSRIVKVHGESAARGAYEDLRGMLSRCVERRSGRVWNFEGDGALAAFLFGHSTTSSVLAGMSLIHELFMYNRMYNRIGEPIRIRAAVHTGPIRYVAEIGEILKQETCREVVEAESKWTPADALSITPAVAGTLDRVLLDRFKPAPEAGSRSLVYTIGLGGA